jgi:hypothetical protein
MFLIYVDDVGRLAVKSADEINAGRGPGSRAGNKTVY